MKPNKKRGMMHRSDSLERKRQRELMRRSFLNEAYESLEKAISDHDPTVRAAEHHGRSQKRRQNRTTIPNRVSMINHAASLVQKMHLQQETLRRRILETIKEQDEAGHNAGSTESSVKSNDDKVSNHTTGNSSFSMLQNESPVKMPRLPTIAPRQHCSAVSNSHQGLPGQLGQQTAIPRHSSIACVNDGFKRTEGHPARSSVDLLLWQALQDAETQQAMSRVFYQAQNEANLQLLAALNPNSPVVPPAVMQPPLLGSALPQTSTVANLLAWPSLIGEVSQAQIQNQPAAVAAATAAQAVIWPPFVQGRHDEGE